MSTKLFYGNEVTESLTPSLWGNSQVATSPNLRNGPRTFHICMPCHNSLQGLPQSSLENNIIVRKAPLAGFILSYCF